MSSAEVLHRTSSLVISRRCLVREKNENKKLWFLHVQHASHVRVLFSILFDKCQNNRNARAVFLFVWQVCQKKKDVNSGRSHSSQGDTWPGTIWMGFSVIPGRIQNERRLLIIGSLSNLAFSWSWPVVWVRSVWKRDTYLSQLFCFVFYGSLFQQFDQVFHSGL